MNIFTSQQILTSIKTEPDTQDPQHPLDGDEKCRICLKIFDFSQLKISISNEILGMFTDLTQTQLAECPRLPKVICAVCNRELREAHLYRLNLIETQRKLIEEVSSTSAAKDAIFFTDMHVKMENEEPEVEMRYLVNDFEASNDFCGSDDDLLMAEHDNKDFEFDHEKYKIIDENGKSLYACNHCDRHMTRSYSLKQHILTMHLKQEVKQKRTDFVCDYCGKKFTTKFSIKTHILTQHMNQPTQRELKGPLVCDICGKHITTAFSLRQHILTQHTEHGKEIFRKGTHVCDHCGQELTTAYSLKKHIQAKHTGPPKAGKPKRKKEVYGSRRPRKLQNYPDDPPFSFETPPEAVHENGKTFYLCHLCDKRITTLFCLKEHILTQHMNLEEKFVCDVENCGRAFVTRCRLNLHLSTHRDCIPTICSICGTQLSSRTTLLKHIKNVHEPKKFSCDICGFAVPVKNQIRKHVLVHIARKNRIKYDCRVCGFQSVSEKSLRRHTYERHVYQGNDFTCDCGKVCNSKTSLQIHIKAVHDKVKNHVCDICGKAFYNKSHFITHNLMKHNRDQLVKNLPCEVCGKLFAFEKSLEYHKMHVHLRFNCEYQGCEEYFNTEKRLARHMKTHDC